MFDSINEILEGDSKVCPPHISLLISPSSQKLPWEPLKVPYRPEWPALAPDSVSQNPAAVNSLGAVSSRSLSQEPNNAKIANNLYSCLIILFFKKLSLVPRYMFWARGTLPLGTHPLPGCPHYIF